MEVLKGIPVSPGVAISTAYVMGQQQPLVPSTLVPPTDVEAEVKRFSAAVASSAVEIEDLKSRIRGTPAERYIAILDAHLAMLTDERLAEEIGERIRSERYNAEHAVARVLAQYARTIEAVDDAYLSQRAGDIHDIQRRLLDALTGKKDRGVTHFPNPVAIVAHDLTPSETLSLDREKVTGFATDAGGSTSHTAIVAKGLSIPAVVGLGRATAATAGGDTIIIDGTRGLLIVNPDEATLKRYRSSQADTTVIASGLGALKDLPAETTDGRRIRLMGNIELPEEIQVALDNGADGVGLFRTEFLFLQAGHEPSEEEQFLVYLNAAGALGDKPLVIRTFDLGGDKVAGGLKHMAERNPSLGCRSIRYCLENPHIFRAQVRAILRASVRGNVRILFPMISSVEEVRRAKLFLAEVRKELQSRAIPFAEDIKIGIMVEVPSVAVAPDAFTPEADFFSIGTNDLIQYTLAVERVNEHVAWLFTPAHPAILRLIKNVVDTGNAARIPVSVCGEMSSDPLFVMFLVGLGIEELSLSPRAIPRIKQIIRSFSFQDARKVAETALTLHNAREVTSFLLKSSTETARVQII